MTKINDRLEIAKANVIGIKQAASNEFSKGTNSGYVKEYFKKLTPFNDYQRLIEKAIKEGIKEDKRTVQEIETDLTDKVTAAKKRLENAEKNLADFKAGKFTNTSEEISEILEKFAPSKDTTFDLKAAFDGFLKDIKEYTIKGTDSKE